MMEERVEIVRRIGEFEISCRLYFKMFEEVQDTCIVQVCKMIGVIEMTAVIKQKQMKGFPRGKLAEFFNDRIGC